MVLLSGPVADLRQSFPESSITLFCGGSNLEVARLVPGLDDVVRLPIARPWKAMGIDAGETRIRTTSIGLLPDLRSTHFWTREGVS